MRLVIAAALLMVTAAAQAESCDNLFYERNSIYKDQGYCFRTPRAIAMFGNAGCQFDDVNQVPLSASQRRLVQAIQGEERRMACVQ